MRNGKHKAGAKAGRKRISDSRAVEIRAALVTRSQVPEPERKSLRALAAELGTSHQLLSFYLRRLMPLPFLERCEASSRRLLANLAAEPGLRLGPIDAALVRVLAKEGVPSAQEAVRKYPEKF
jgi:hypothetical protein